MDQDVKVIYIAGISHSGSTLLGHTLGEVERFVYGGEIRNIWQRGLLEDRACCCGVSFRKCPFWSTVIKERFPALSHAEITTFAQFHARHVRLRGLPAFAGFGSDHRLVPPYRDSLVLLYRAIRDVANADVVVDSSKSPWYAWVLGTSPGIDLSIVHLVRDPRGNVYSFMRRGRVARHEIVARAGRWLSWNVATESLARVVRARYVRVRYEDFVQSPQASLEEIGSGVGVAVNMPAKLSGSRITLQPKHIFSGNRARGVVGEVNLRLDDDWRQVLPRPVQLAITATAAPLVRRYGYPILSDRPPREERAARTG